MKITALIVDDEQHARDELAFLLESVPGIGVIGQGKNGIEAVSLIRSLSPQLVFLDVEMPGLDGLGVIKKLMEKKVTLPHFIFATAYDHYAVQAFEVNALDYLLKPVSRPRLAKAMERVQRALEASESTHQKLDRLVQMMEERPSTAAAAAKLIVKNGGRWMLVDASSVVYASIQDGVITIVTRELEGESNFRTMEELQNSLDPNVFWRVHRSFLVNILHIKEVVPWFKSSFQLKMEDRRHTEIPVSRAHTQRLREFLKL